MAPIDENDVVTFMNQQQKQKQHATADNVLNTTNRSLHNTANNNIINKFCISQSDLLNNIIINNNHYNLLPRRATSEFPVTMTSAGVMNTSNSQNHRAASLGPVYPTCKNSFTDEYECNYETIGGFSSEKSAILRLEKAVKSLDKGRQLFMTFKSLIFSIIV